jgi:hypothetical protein
VNVTAPNKVLLTDPETDDYHRMYVGHDMKRWLSEDNAMNMDYAVFRGDDVVVNMDISFRDPVSEVTANKMKAKRDKNFSAHFKQNNKLNKKNNKWTNLCTKDDLFKQL